MSGSGWGGRGPFGGADGGGGGASGAAGPGGAEGANGAGGSSAAGGASDNGSSAGAGGANGTAAPNGARGVNGAGAIPVSPSGRAATPLASLPSPPPIVNAEGVPALGPVADAINSVAAPFQQGPDTRGKNTAEAALLWTAHIIKAGTGVLGAAAGIIDGGVAGLGHAIGELTGISYPALPAVTILSLHAGPPHSHPHPPSECRCRASVKWWGLAP